MHNRFLKTGMVRLLLGLLLLLPSGLASAQEGEPGAAASAPPADPPVPPEVHVETDGAVIQPDGSIVRYWQVNHQMPTDVLKELTAFGLAGVKAEAKGKNILKITAPAAKWPIVEQLLEVVDVPDPQVFVEAKIIEIRYDSNLEFGLEASYDRRKGTDTSQPFFGKFVGNFNPESYLESLVTGKPWGGGEFEFENHPGSVEERGEWNVTLRALQERGNAEILSQPSIIALQGEQAEINTGLDFPVQAVEIRGNQSFVTTKFEKTGITLKVTPELVGRDYVRLVIDAQDKQITERIQGSAGSLVPVISSRTAKTKVSVRDGETVIIGGLLTSSTIEAKSGLPLLSDIPIVGYLFSSTRSQEVKSELVFFITPRIIKRKEQTVILPPSEADRLR